MPIPQHRDVNTIMPN